MAGQVKTPDLGEAEPTEWLGGKYKENDLPGSLSLRSIVKITIRRYFQHSDH